MSGSVATIVSAVAGLTGSVTLGGVELTGLATPERINFGGQQQHTLHKLPGGARIVDAMGPDEDDVRFSGLFIGPLAADSAQTLDAMRQSGRPVTLAWSGFARQVLVTSFAATVERGGWLMPYRVRCLVIPSTTAGTAAPGTTLLGSFVNDIGNALGVPNLMGTLPSAMAQVSSALATAQQLLPVAGVLTAGSPAFLSFASAIGAAQNVMSTGLSATESSMGALLAGAANTGTPIGTLNPGAAAAALAAAAASTQSLAGLWGMNAYLTRIANNLANAGA